MPNDPANEEMPWGEYKGKPLKDIPIRYLDWLIGNDWMDAPNNTILKSQIEAYLKTQAEWNKLEDEADEVDEGEYHGKDEWRNW